MKKSCCIYDGCGMPYDMDAPENRNPEDLLPFWQMYCPRHRGNKAGEKTIAIAGITAKQVINEHDGKKRLPKKGLLVWIYRNAEGGDCTNGGMSSNYCRAILIGEGIPEIFEPTEETPALVLVRRALFSSRLNARHIYFHCEPLETYGKALHMFGGNYIADSDSRFPCDYPIPIHDRIE